ncbi:MAG: hypothetical protein M1838_004732, partial [Thelocarpon superellum]
PSSAAPALTFSPFAHVFPSGLTGPGSYQTAATPVGPSATSSFPHAYTMSEFRPRNSSSASGMPPPSRSPAASMPVSPSFVASARDNYTTSTPHLMRHSMSNRSPVDLVLRSPLGATPRSNDGSTNHGLSAASTNTYGPGTAAMPFDPMAQLSLTTGGPGPPLQSTSVIYHISAADGQSVRPEINARIDKGFFLADQDWTCYRRNYFSVACSYTLRPQVTSGPLYLLRPNGPVMTDHIQGFAMSIAAVVDGVGGKAVELVQHTPKRDKGPQGKPERVKLSPHPGGSVGMLPGRASACGLSPGQGGFDPAYGPPGGEQRTVANFERIQFKSATANNGKRRAAQQYYHLIVELYAEVGSSYVKVASRISVPMVVRGRSPGHYQDNRRGSSSSTGPGGAGGGDGGTNHPSLSSGPSSGRRSMADAMSMMGGAGAMLGNGGYQTLSGGSSLHQSPSSLNNPSLSSGSSSTEHVEDPTEHGLGADEGTTTMTDSPAYPYYPAPPFFESHLHHLRPSSTLAPSLPPFPVTGYGTSSYPSADGHGGRGYAHDDTRRMGMSRDDAGPNLTLPSVPWHGAGFGGRDYTRHQPTFRAPCGRLEAMETARGYYSNLPA